MKTCKHQLDRLADQCEPLRQAVDNLLADLWHQHDNPNGNIKALLAVRLGDACKEYPEAEVAHLDQVMNAHRAPNLHPDLRGPDQALRRVCSATTFARYHLNRMGSDAAGSDRAILA